MADREPDHLVMSGAREAIAGGFTQLEQQVALIEAANPETAGLVFDAARAMIEGTCRRILEERQVPYARRDDVPNLFRAVTNRLPLLPPAESGSANLRTSISQTLGALNSAVQGICELRNQLGLASHGESQPRPTLDWAHARMAAMAADTVVGFLFQIYEKERPAPGPALPGYNDYPAFNREIDAAHEAVTVLDAEFRASAVLHAMEPETYRVHLTEFLARAGRADESEEAEQSP